MSINHMLHRLCGPPSIPLSPCGVLQVDYLSLSLGHRQSQYRVIIVYGVDYQYLILFAPHAFVPQRQ